MEKLSRNVLATALVSGTPTSWQRRGDDSVTARFGSMSIDIDAEIAAGIDNGHQTFSIHASLCQGGDWVATALTVLSSFGYAQKVSTPTKEPQAAVDSRPNTSNSTPKNTDTQPLMSATDESTHQIDQKNKPSMAQAGDHGRQTNTSTVTSTSGTENTAAPVSAPNSALSTEKTSVAANSPASQSRAEPTAAGALPNPLPNAPGFGQAIKALSLAEDQAATSTTPAPAPTPAPTRSPFKTGFGSHISQTRPTAATTQSPAQALDQTANSAPNQQQSPARTVKPGSAFASAAGASIKPRPAPAAPSSGSTRPPFKPEAAGTVDINF